jgi:hypothetical protein
MQLTLCNSITTCLLDGSNKEVLSHDVHTKEVYYRADSTIVWLTTL